MTIPTAEVMITPELSRQGLRYMEQEFKRSYKKVGDDLERQTERSITKGGNDAFRRLRTQAGRAFRGAGGAIGRGVDNLGGVRGIATGVLGLGLVSYLDRIDKAEQGNALLASLLAENNAQQQIATARGAGLTLEQFAQFSRTLEQGGFREQQDINDVIFDINERAALAARGDETILSNYSGLQGQELLNSVLAGISQLDVKSQQAALADLGFGGEVGQNLQNVIQNAERQALINEGKAVTDENLATVSGAQVLEVLNEQNKTDAQRLADQLRNESELTKEYREREREFQDKAKKTLFDQIDNGKLDTFFDQRQTELEQQKKLIADFEANQESARLARETIKTLMNGLNETVKLIEQSVVGIARYLGVGVETKAQNDASKTVIQAPASSAITTEQLTRSINNIRL